MSLISKNLASLTGGVSQQAPALRLSNQCEKQENFRSSLVNGLQSRRGIKQLCTIGVNNGAFYPIDRDETGKYNLIVNSKGLTVTDINGGLHSVNIDKEALNYLSSKGTNPYEIYKTLTLADYTYILNTEKTVKMTDDIYEPWKNQALVFIKQVAASTTYTLVIDGKSYSVGYGGTNNDTGLPDLFEQGSKLVEDTHMSTTQIAQKFKEYFGMSYDIVQMGSVLWIKKKDGSPFSIGLSDTRGDDYSNLITTSVQQFSELPTIAPDGYITKVIGSVSSGADDYYVMFKTDGGGEMGKGVWQECAAPGSQCVIDGATMPHILVHEANGKWTFKKQEWKEKLTGDDDTNPIPPFIDKRLRNIFLYANRLCFLTEDLLCMSAAADFENFWNETATTLTDSDPIFISASTDTVADLYDFGIQDDDLIVFGTHNQYRLYRADVLSPKTASLSSTATNTYAKNTGVVAAGSRLYFGHQKAKWFSINEFGTSAYTGSKEAVEITSHVPNYIPFTNILRLCGTETTSTLTVWTTDTPDSLYMYQYYVSGTNKLQSAWCRYTIKNGNIKGAFYRQNILWLFLTKSNTNFIAYIDMAEHTQDATELCLDFVTTYKTDTPKHEFKIASWYAADNITVLTEVKKNVYKIIEPISNTNGLLKFDRNITNITVGEKYKRVYVFSTPYITSKNASGGQNTTITGRWQIQTLTLFTIDSGYFKVIVKPSYDDNAKGYCYIYSGVTSGTETAITGDIPVESLEFSLPVRLKNTETIATIETDSHLPQAIINAVWQGFYITKVRQI